MLNSGRINFWILRVAECWYVNVLSRYLIPGSSELEFRVGTLIHERILYCQKIRQLFLISVAFFIRWASEETCPRSRFEEKIDSVRGNLVLRGSSWKEMSCFCFFFISHRDYNSEALYRPPGEVWTRSPGAWWYLHQRDEESCPFWRPILPRVRLQPHRPQIPPSRQ